MVKLTSCSWCSWCWTLNDKSNSCFSWLWSRYLQSKPPSPGGENEEWLCLHRGIVFTSERMSVGYALMDDQGVWRTKVWSSTTGQHELAFIETLSRSCLNFVLELYISFASCLMSLYDEISSWLKPQSTYWDPSLLRLIIMHISRLDQTPRKRRSSSAHCNWFEGVALHRSKLIRISSQCRCSSTHDKENVSARSFLLLFDVVMKHF